MYDSLTPLLKVTAVYLVFHASGYYISIYFIVNKLLAKQKYFLSILSFAALVTILGIGIATGIYFIFGKGVEQFFGSIYNLAMVGITSNVMIVSTMVGLKLGFDRLMQQKKQEEIKKQQLESELQYLKAQINPHFLFNAINNIYFLIKKDPQVAADTLIKLSDLLRYQLYDCSGDRIAIDKEVECIQNFVSLEKIRKDDKLQVSMDTNGLHSNFELAPLLLIPLVENAFKYVSNHTEQPNKINIVLSKTGRYFKFQIFNTKDDAKAAQTGGIGLKNIQRRLELLYPDKHELIIKDTKTDFFVELILEIDE